MSFICISFSKTLFIPTHAIVFAAASINELLLEILKCYQLFQRTSDLLSVSIILQTSINLFVSESSILVF